MIKKITMLIFLILLSVTISLGQMATLEQKTAYPNTTTNVAVNVDDLSNINALTFYINFDADVLDYIGLSDQALPGMLADISGSVISITWASSVAYSPSGVLCKLNFLYKGTSCDLDFLPGCEVVQGTTPFLVGYANGSISQAPCMPSDAQASFGSAMGSSGSYVSFPAQFSNFPDVGAFTQYIHYDASQLTFISLSLSGNLSGAVYNVNNGVITISWVAPVSSPQGKNINTLPGSGNGMALNFQCVFPGNSLIEFGPGGLFTTGIPMLENIPVCYSSGSFSQVPTLETAVIGSLTGVIQGDDVLLPLNLNISQPISGFTLYLNVNSPVISFTSIEAVDPLSNSVISAVAGNVVTLVFTNLSPSVISSGTFLNLKFHYNGIGAGLVSFGSMSEFTDGFFQPVNVSFTNSTIAPGVFPPNATVTIGSVPAVFNSFVEVPVDIDGATSNPIGAATMFIAYDAEKLSFIGAIDNIYNANVNYSGNQISIAWADPVGANLTGTFLKLKFQYNGSGSTGCGSDLYFINDNLTLQPCELANNAASFVPANWINGGVNLSPALPVINGPANPAENSTVNYSTDPGMINYSWTVTGGVISSGDGTPLVSVSWGSAGNGAIAVNYHTMGGCLLSNNKPVTILSGGPITNIEGYVTYDNAASQGLNGVNIALINSMGMQVGPIITTVTNGTHGYYSFIGVPQDSYTMVVSTTAPWAGVPYVSATDALLDELHTAGLLVPGLSGIRFLAANVNGGFSVNATDALFIKKRIIGDITAFPAGDWVFDTGIITAYNSPVTSYNFKGLCAGDVNGSYNAIVGAKSTSLIEVDDDELLMIKTGESFVYNIKSSINADLGALTMFLGYDPATFEIESVKSPLSGLEYSVHNGTVVIACSDAKSVRVNVNDVIVAVTMKAKQYIEEPEMVFNLKTGTELAGPSADVLESFGLKMAKIQSTSFDLHISNYPNPFRATTNISFTIPEKGSVKLTITNLVGKEICILKDEIVEAGSYTLKFNSEQYNLSPGIYFEKIEFESSGEKISKVNKIILIN